MTVALERQAAGRRRVVVTTLGLHQILSWGSSFYLLSVLGAPIAADTGWPLAAVAAGLSVALLAAGLISPLVGRVIQRHGGRPVLAAGSVLLALGLALLAVAPAFPVYIAAWTIIGLGMGAGLYDPVFSTLGSLYGQGARRLITAVTLFGGFASTVSWPMTALLLENLGWRGACVVYALLNIGFGLPACLLLLPKTPEPAPAAGGGAPPIGLVTPELPAARQRVALLLLGASLTIGAATLSMMSMHLLTLLQARGVDLAAAVLLGTLVGPAQVGARVVEMAFGRHYHPVWTMLIGVVLVALGVVLLWTGWPVAAAALIAYGAGNGISSIVRGTVPLVLFGADGFAVLMGRLGLPILLAMALAPAAGAVLLDYGGGALTFGVMSAMSLINIALVLMLLRWCR